MEAVIQEGYRWARRLASGPLPHITIVEQISFCTAPSPSCCTQCWLLRGTGPSSTALCTPGQPRRDQEPLGYLNLSLSGLFFGPDISISREEPEEPNPRVHAMVKLLQFELGLRLPVQEWRLAVQRVSI